MLNKNKITKIIAKYALILIVLYLIQFTLDFLFDSYFEQHVEDITKKMWLPNLSLGMTILFNLITAIILNTDIWRLQLKSRYLTIMTLVWRPLGICLFLISLINQSRDENL